MINTGNVYEKRIIEAYISENGTEPTTGEELTAEDLIDLRISRTVRPRPPTLTSIPSLLGVFQEEWDALALETYTLTQNLVQTRQELSTALYQHDAAVRVIARLTRERDEAREALSKVSIGSRAAPTNGDAMQVDSAGLPDALIARVDETKAKYVDETGARESLLTRAGLRRPEERDRSRKTGRLKMKFPQSSHVARLNPYIRAESSSRSTNQEIWLWSEDRMGSLEYTRYLKLVFCKH